MDGQKDGLSIEGRICGKFGSLFISPFIAASYVAKSLAMYSLA